MDVVSVGTQLWCHISAFPLTVVVGVGGNHYAGDRPDDGGRTKDPTPEPCEGLNCKKCTNPRVYISNLAEGTNYDDIVDVFKQIGTLARER